MILGAKGGAKSIRQAKMSGNRRRLCLKCCTDKLAPAFSTAQPLSVLLPAFSQGGAMVRYAQRRLFVCVRTWQARGLPDCSEKESLRCMPKQTNGAGTRKSRPRLSETAVVTYQMPPDVGTAAERTSAEASSTSCGTVSTRTNCCTSPAAWLAVHVSALPDRLPIS